jgi:hypothetical protein
MKQGVIDPGVPHRSRDERRDRERREWAELRRTLALRRQELAGLRARLAARRATLLQLRSLVTARTAGVGK